MALVKVEAFAVVGANDELISLRHTRKEALELAKIVAFPDYYFLWGPSDQQEPPVLVAHFGATVRKCTISFEAERVRKKK